MLIGLPVKLVRLPDLLVDSKLNCSDLLNKALLSGYKALGDYNVYIAPSGTCIDTNILFD